VSQDEAAKYELLFKRDQDMTAFIDKFDEVLVLSALNSSAGASTYLFLSLSSQTRDGVLAEQSQAKAIVVALLEHISRSVDESSHMPSQEQLGERAVV
jgi:hypothetical protein